MPVTAEDARNIRFERARFGIRGYHEAEVDAFLDRVATTLETGEGLTAPEVHGVAFSKAPLGRRGYDRAAVDGFLRQVENTFAERLRNLARDHGPYLAPALEHTHARSRWWRKARI